MPRVTRAALRSNALLEESTVAALTPLPLTPLKERVALGEITDNQGPAHEMIEVVKDAGKVKPGKTGPGQGKKGRVAKKGKKHVPKAEEAKVEVLEDDNQSETSSAVEDACQDLMKESSGEVYQVAMHDQRPRTPPSPAVRALQNLLSSGPQTPRFDPKVHRSEDQILGCLVEGNKDAFAEAIISRTPAKMISTDKASDEANNTQVEDHVTSTEEDSFVAHIQARSPAKPVSRIEDSVEAIDAFEAEIEKVGELLPAIHDDTQPATEDTTPSKVADWTPGNPTHSDGPNPSAESILEASEDNETKAMRKENNSNPRNTLATRSAQPTTRKTTARTDISRVSSLRTTASSKPSPKARATPHSRVSSLQHAPFQPTKSSKPLTRSTFELPGEAVSRKLKEQREERLKKEAEKETPKKTFKARPVRLSHATVVRPTATSNARISLAKADPSDPHPKAAKNQAPKIKPITTRDSMTTTNGSKRISTLSVAKRAPTPCLEGSARVTRGPSLSSAVPPRTASMTSRASLAAGPSRTANASLRGSIRQTSRGKEVFGRTKLELEAREKERKEKEEAARKARVEAAERGRLASRMWAEKQKARKMGGEKAVSEKLEGGEKAGDGVGL